MALSFGVFCKFWFSGVFPSCKKLKLHLSKPATELETKDTVSIRVIVLQILISSFQFNTDWPVTLSLMLHFT